jgi:PAS domain S-box-containing protein
MHVINHPGRPPAAAKIGRPRKAKCAEQHGVVWRINCGSLAKPMDTGRRSKILIIEDNAIDREVYKRCLWQSSGAGFEFAEADCGTDGIGMAAAWQPDCALVDVNLPDMDGIEALARLRADCGRIPFAAVVLTAYSEEAVAVRAMQAGAMDYLPKGKVTADTLPHVVRNAIDRFLMQQRIEQQRSALEKSGQRYQVLLEAMPQMVWTADAEGRVEYANRRWMEYTGLGEADAARLEWDRIVHAEDRERTRLAWNQAVGSGDVFEIESRLRRAADGTHRWHLIRAIPMRGGEGETTTWFGTCTEIESQKRSGEAVLEKQKMESLGRLAGGLAHDLNNHLVVIQGGASYAMEKLPPSDPTLRTLQDVVEAGDRAAELIRKMLAYAGKGNVRVARTRVDPLVRDAIAQAGVPQSIRLEFQSGRRVPPVETDSELLRQAIADLVRNAVEAIGEQASGSISVRTAVVEFGGESGPREVAPAGIAPGAYVAVEVADTGCGMDEETQKKIFEPFFTTKFMGRGLGLAAVHGFARSNGGGVQVNSTPGKGASFRLLLPAAAGSRAAQAVEGA